MAAVVQPWCGSKFRVSLIISFILQFFFFIIPALLLHFFSQGGKMIAAYNFSLRKKRKKNHALIKSPSKILKKNALELH